MYPVGDISMTQKESGNDEQKKKGRYGYRLGCRLTIVRSKVSN